MVVGSKNTNVTVFLDRDGTINEDRGYLSDPDDLVLIEGAEEAIKRLNAEDIKVIVVSNQSGVGRGYFTHEDVAEVNKKLAGLLSLFGAQIDGIYYCPHHPDEDCGCRKPRSGLAEAAIREHGVDPVRSYVVGDKATDIGMARNISAKGVLVMTGDGPEEVKKLKGQPDFIARDLLNAVEWIIDDIKKTQRA